LPEGDIVENHLVKDFMIPISEYATVVLGTSLANALIALEKAQEAHTSNKYQHRAILVLDDTGDVVGKIGQLRALQAIEPQNDFNEKIKEIGKYNFSKEYIAQLRDKYRSKEPILKKEALKIIANKKVEEFMQKPKAGSFVSVDRNLDEAIHKLAAGRLQSLLVTRNGKIVGVLRMADVFSVVSQEIKALEG
jgi:CBS-domain-containing membrane protein